MSLIPFAPLRISESKLRKSQQKIKNIRPNRALTYSIVEAAGDGKAETRNT
jgi:hypothetical protein